MTIITGFSASAAVTGICLSFVSLLANRERAKYTAGSPTFNMQRSLSYAWVVVAIIASCMALYMLLPNYQGQANDAMVPAVISLSSMLGSIIFSFYEVRLGENHLWYGLKARKKIEYSSIVEIQDIRNERSFRIVLVTNTGKRIGIWSNLLGYDHLVQEMKHWCQCTYNVINTGRTK